MADLVAGNFRTRFNDGQPQFSSDGGVTWFALMPVPVANGAVATTVTALGPVGSSTTIVRWAKIPDGAGGFFLLPSYL